MTDPKKLPDTNDGVEDQLTVTGVLSADDEDAYEVYVADESGAFVVPAISTLATNVDLCVYIECFEVADTITDIDCGESGTAATYSNKIKGCCGTAPVIDDYGGCSIGGLGNDSVNAYFQIKNKTQQCVEYNIDYQF